MVARPVIADGQALSLIILDGTWWSRLSCSNACVVKSEIGENHLGDGGWLALVTAMRIAPTTRESADLC